MSRNRAMTGVEFQKFLRQPINSFILINIDSIRINKNYKRVKISSRCENVGEVLFNSLGIYKPKH